MVRRRSVRVRIQSETAECGLTCLAMIADYHGARVNVLELRDRFRISTGGTSVRRLVEIADGLGLSARPINAGLGRLQDITLPCILHWRFNHFVVLERLTIKGAFIVDPAIGASLVDFEELSKHYTGIAVELHPRALINTTASGSDVSRLLAFLEISREKLSIVLVIIASLVIQLLAAFVPFLSRVLIDRGIEVGTGLLFVQIITAVLCTLLLTHVARFARDLIAFELSRTFHYQMGQNVFRHLLSLPLSFFERRNKFELVAKFESIRELRNLIVSETVNVVLDGVFFTATLVLCTLLNPWLTGLVLCSFILVLILRITGAANHVRLQNEMLHSQSALGNHVLETITGIGTIKLASMEAPRQAGWLNLFERHAAREQQLVHREILQSLCVDVIRTIDYAALLLGASYLILGGKISIGTMFAFVAYRQQLMDRASPLFDSYRRFSLARMQISRMNDIIGTPAERLPSGRVQTIDKLHSISVEHLSFRYAEDSPWILRDCTLQIAASDFTALVGPSGAGKTTFLKLLLGLMEPTQGRIVVGGASSEACSLADFRGDVGAVLQDDVILSGTIAENISAFDADCDLEWVRRCAEVACIEKEIDQLPMQFQTFVGDGASLLSAGQRQRIMLARAIYKRPKILILDEGTANLDVVTEGELLRNLTLQGFGLFAITHKPELLKHCDHVLELSAATGQIVEVLTSKALQVV